MSKLSLENTSIPKLFFRFALPSVLGMLIVSMQMMVDGFFIANTVGAAGLAAINLSIPVINLYTSIAMMICAGGAVYTSIELGKGNFERGNEVFSFTFSAYIVILGVLSFLGAIFIDEIIYLLGTNSELIPYVKPYLLTMLILNLLFNFPIFSEIFVKVGELPNYVFVSSIICITGNVIGDYILIIKLGMGVFGAAFATALANGTAGFVLLTRFFKGRCRLKFTKPKGDRQLLGKILYNGSSEMLTLVSSAVTTYVFNLLLMKYIGALGVSALTIVFYVNNILNICLYGLDQAMQPIVSFNLGAKRFDKIKEVLRITLISGATLGVFFFGVMKFKSDFIVKIFSKGNLDLEILTMEVLGIVIFQYLVSFINVAAIGFLTALEKPFESMLVSFFRSLVFTISYLLILPKFFGNSGLWGAMPAGELSCIVISIPLMWYSFQKAKRTNTN